MRVLKFVMFSVNFEIPGHPASKIEIYIFKYIAVSKFSDQVDSSVVIVPQKKLRDLDRT